MSIRAKFLKNSFFNVAGWTWLAVLNIATIPYIVNKLGYDQYGILSLVFLVLGYFAFLDFGLGDAVIKFVSHYYALGKIDKINRIINSILFLFFIIGLVGALLILIFSRFFALKIFKIPLSFHPTARYCFYLSAVGFFLNIILGVYSKIPEALQRFDVSNRINILVGTLVSLSNVLVLFCGYGLKQVVVVNIMGSVLGIILFYSAARRIIPQLSFNFRFNSNDFKEVFHFGTYTIFTKLGGLISDSISQVFIGAIIGTVSLTIFNVPFKIVSRFQSFIYRLAAIFFPLSSELYAQNNMDKLQNSYLKLSRYVFLLSSFFFVPLLAFSREILYYWMGGDVALKGASVMFLISLNFYFITLSMVPALAASGLGKPKYNAIFTSLTGTINLLLVYPLTKAWGINGAAMALFLSSLQVPIAIFVINKKIVQVDSKKYFTFVFGRSLLVIILVYLFFQLVLSKLMINGFYFFSILGVSYFILLLVFYLIGLVKEDREFFRSKIFQYLR